VLYDFYDVQGDVVSDGSGHGRAGTLIAATLVQGRRKPAVQLAGTGRVAAESLGAGVALASHALTVGAMCRPDAVDGVVVSMGDSQDGFSLYLKDGRPHFAVRSGGTLHEVADVEPLEAGRFVHLAGVVGAKGELWLLVNAFPVATSASRVRWSERPRGRCWSERRARRGRGVAGRACSRTCDSTTAS
jgi:hypothetical protein